MKKLDWKTCLKLGLTVFIVYVAIYHWQDAENIAGVLAAGAVPLIIGCVAAYLINILMSFYERHYFRKKQGRFTEKSRRPVCMLAAIVTLIAIIALVMVLVVPEFISCMQLLLDEAPKTIEKIMTWFKGSDWLAEELDKLNTDIDWRSKSSQIIRNVTSGLGDVLGFVAGTLSSVFSVASTAIIGILFAVYILSSKERLGSQFDRLMKAYMPEKWYRRTEHVLIVMDDCFHKFIVGQCIEALILGGLCAVGMLIIRLPYATMVGALIAFTALIPIAGAYIGAGVGAFMILTVSPVKALIFLVFIVLLQQFEGNVIYPRVVGSSIGLPGIWVLAAITIGGGLLGVVGMLLAVPLAATVYRLLKEDVAKRELKAE